MEAATDNSLGEQVRTLYQCIELTEKDYMTRYEIRDDASKMVRNIFTKAEIHIVGSVASKMASLNSDLDLLVNTSACDNTLSEKEKVDLLVENLKTNSTTFGDIQVMSSNNVCLIMMRHISYNVPVTLRFDHMENLRIALFMKALAELHPTLRMFCVVVREWALARELIRRKGALTGYTIALLVVYYFEQIGEISVDTVRILSKSSNKEELKRLIQNWQIGSEATASKLGDLFNGFMHYFGKFGLFESALISLLDDKTMKRPREMKNFKVCIIDPVTGTNAGRCYSRMSDPEEPFVKTAANLRKDNNLYTACFRRSNYALRKRKNPLFELPVFKNMGGINNNRGKWTSLGQRRQVFDAVNHVVRNVQNQPNPSVNKFASSIDQHPNVTEVAQKFSFVMQQHEFPVINCHILPATRTRSYPDNLTGVKLQSRTGVSTNKQERLKVFEETNTLKQVELKTVPYSTKIKVVRNANVNLRQAQRPSSEPSKSKAANEQLKTSNVMTLAKVIKTQLENENKVNTKRMESTSDGKENVKNDITKNCCQPSSNISAIAKKASKSSLMPTSSTSTTKKDKKIKEQSGICKKNFEVKKCLNKLKIKEENKQIQPTENTCTKEVVKKSSDDNANSIMNDLTNKCLATSPSWTPVVKRRSRASRNITSIEVDKATESLPISASQVNHLVPDEKRVEHLSSSVGSLIMDHREETTVAFGETSTVITSPDWVEVKNKKSRSSNVINGRKSFSALGIGRLTREK